MIKIQKSIILPYTSNQQPKNKTKIISFTVTSKRKKYIGINLGNKTYTLKTESMLRDIKDLCKWRDISNHVHGSEYSILF